MERPPLEDILANYQRVPMYTSSGTALSTKAASFLPPLTLQMPPLTLDRDLCHDSTLNTVSLLFLLLRFLLADIYLLSDCSVIQEGKRKKQRAKGKR